MILTPLTLPSWVDRANKYRSGFGVTPENKGFAEAFRKSSQNKNDRDSVAGSSKTLESIFKGNDVWTRFSKAKPELRHCVAIRWLRLRRDGSPFMKLKKEVASNLRYEKIEEFTWLKFFEFLKDPPRELQAHKTKRRSKAAQVYFTRHGIRKKLSDFVFRKTAQSNLYSLSDICRAMKVCWEKLVKKQQKTVINVFRSPSCNGTKIIWPEGHKYLQRMNVV